MKKLKVGNTRINSAFGDIIIEINIKTPNTLFDIYFETYPLNSKIIWGDGDETSLLDDEATVEHTYSSIGIYYIRFVGEFKDLPLEYKTMITRVLSWGNPEITNLSSISFNNCTSLISLPNERGGLKKIDISEEGIGIFYNCSSLKSIPNGLFDGCVSQTLHEVFRGCTSLTSIPKDIFKYMPNITEVDGTFLGCTSLENIPSELFKYNPNIYMMTQVFEGCTSLTSIPTGLFDNNPLLSRLSRCFYGCSSIVNFPTDLFDNNTDIVRVDYLFYNCVNLIGDAFLFWESGGNWTITDSEYCYTNATKLNNYDDIPLCYLDDSVCDSGEE